MKLTSLVVAFLLAFGATLAQDPPRPSRPPSRDEFLGFPLGGDRKLADYHQVVEYLKVLDDASDRLTLLTLGRTTLGNDMVMAAISAPRNLERSIEFREMARKLADPRLLDTGEAERIIREGQVIVLVTCNIHSSEIGASQMALELAHLLATTDDPRLLGHLQNVILMGSTGPRIFVPPFSDPLALNIPPLIWRMTDLIGTNMALRLEQAGRPGVIDSWSYDGH